MGLYAHTFVFVLHRRVGEEPSSILAIVFAIEVP